MQVWLYQEIQNITKGIFNRGRYLSVTRGGNKKSTKISIPDNPRKLISTKISETTDVKQTYKNIEQNIIDRDWSVSWLTAAAFRNHWSLVIFYIKTCLIYIVLILSTKKKEKKKTDIILSKTVAYVQKKTLYYAINQKFNGGALSQAASAEI